MRVVALDYGSARCGVAVSDPTGTLATPRDPVLRPGDQEGLRGAEGGDRASSRPSGSSSGCRCRSPARDSAQTIEVREFAERLARAIAVPVELYDERFTTSLALQAGGTASLDSRAAATLLDEWLRLPIREENPPQALTLRRPPR